MVTGNEVSGRLIPFERDPSLRDAMGGGGLKGHKNNSWQFRESEISI